MPKYHSSSQNLYCQKVCAVDAVVADIGVWFGNLVVEVAGPDEDADADADADKHSHGGEVAFEIAVASAVDAGKVGLGIAEGHAVDA